VTASEGTIHFAYDLNPPEAGIADAANAAPAADEARANLSAWAQLLGRIGLIDASRSGSAISYRESSGAPAFAISPPGGQPPPDARVARPDRPIRIVGCNLDRCWIDAEGVVAPGPETLWHGALYAACPRINWVIQARCPELWRHAAELGVPQTDASISAQSPALMSALAQAVDQNQSRPLVIATNGDEDGVFACGPTARDTGGLLISYLARALALQAAA
jgi:hypothetical protein